MATKQSAVSSQPEKLVRRSAADIQKYIKSAKFRADAAKARGSGPEPSARAMEELPDFGGLDPTLFRPVKCKVTTRIDADILAWLRHKHPKYQTVMNNVLREAMKRDLSEYETRPRKPYKGLGKENTRTKR